MNFDWNMQYTIGKIFLRVKDVFLASSKQILFDENRNIQNFETTKVPILEFPFRSLREKMLGCSPHGESHIILWEGEWCLFSKVASCVKLELEIVPTKSIAPLAPNLHELPFVWLCTLISY
jgi:hypothetical protein